MSAPESSHALQQQAHRQAKWLSLWQSRGWLTKLLWPLSKLFAAVVALRQRAFARGWRAQYRMPIPVVVVGGIMVGGVGKTPIVAQLVRSLQQAGFRPAIIARGYGGKFDPRAGELHAMRVSPSSLASEVGDEPLQHALNTGVPVWVSPSRVDAARAVSSMQSVSDAHPECDVIVCDDGLQHYRLYRDIELVVMDERGVGNGWCLPAGPLREPPERLSSVFAVVQHVRGADALDSAPREFAWMPEPLDTPQYVVHSALGQAYGLSEQSQRCELSAFAARSVLRCAGIARPQVFFDMLAQAGVVGEVLALPDHAPFDDALARALLARDFEVLLVTEKDAVKCLPWVQTHPELAQKIWVVPLAVVPNADWAHLTEQIVARLRTITN